MQLIFPQNACSWAMQTSCNEQLFSALCNTSQIQKYIKNTSYSRKTHTKWKIKGSPPCTHFVSFYQHSDPPFTPTKMTSECSLCTNGCIRILKEPSGLQERWGRMKKYPWSLDVQSAIFWSIWHHTALCVCRAQPHTDFSSTGECQIFVQNPKLDMKKMRNW